MAKKQVQPQPVMRQYPPSAQEVLDMKIAELKEEMKEAIEMGVSEVTLRSVLDWLTLHGYVICADVIEDMPLRRVHRESILNVYSETIR